MEYEDYQRGLRGVLAMVKELAYAKPARRAHLNIGAVETLENLLGVPPAASDSPSQSQPEKPSEGIICDAGAPRKVWVVQRKDRHPATASAFGSGDAAYRYLFEESEGESYITEYEVADG